MSETQKEKPMKNAVEGLYEDYVLSLKHNLILRDEILELKAKLEKAKETLRFYADMYDDEFDNLTAIEALKELEG